MSKRRGRVPKVPSKPPDFEAMAQGLVGRLVMVYSELDSNLALYVAGWRGKARREDSLAELDSTSFKAKLDLVLLAARQEYGDTAACISDWQAWLEMANQLRRTRNDFMHGRWGILERQAVVINVTGLPGLPSKREVRYTLADLSEEVELGVHVARQFAELCSKWPL